MEMFSVIDSIHSFIHSCQNSGLRAILGGARNLFLEQMAWHCTLHIPKQVPAYHTCKWEVQLQLTSLLRITWTNLWCSQKSIQFHHCYWLELHYIYVHDKQNHKPRTPTPILAAKIIITLRISIPITRPILRICKTAHPCIQLTQSNPQIPSKNHDE